MCFYVKLWGEAPQNNCNNINLDVVHLIYFNININKMVIEAVSEYPGILVTPAGSTAAVFAVVHAAAVVLILSLVGFFRYPFIYLQSYGSLTINCLVFDRV